MQGPPASDSDERPQSVGTILATARRAGVARLDAQLLVAHRLGRGRAWVIAHDEWLLCGSEVVWLQRAVEQRASGVPLAYLTGRKEFRGLELEVSTAVLVPRPETEGLVDWALELLGDNPAQDHSRRVVDLGTGSGAIALAIKHARANLSVTAVDCSEAALSMARANASKLGLAVEFVQGDWWQALCGRRFDIAVSNPPYIAAGDPHLEQLRDEPLLALTPGSDGLSALQSVVGSAGAHLECGGWLLLEHGHDQAQRVQQMLSAAGFQDVSTRTDLAGLPRCSAGRWPGRPDQRPMSDGAGGFAV